MHSFAPFLIPLFLLSLSNYAFATTHEVAVGQHALQFLPSTINASIGDTIRFTFYGMHSVIQSNFSTPCRTIFEGFQGGITSDCGVCDDAPQPFEIKIGDGKPVWFYCGIPGHCQAGMVGVINPTPNQTLAEYTAAAAVASFEWSSELPYDEPAVGVAFANETLYPNASLSSQSGNGSLTSNSTTASLAYPSGAGTAAHAEFGSQNSTNSSSGNASAVTISTSLNTSLGSTPSLATKTSGTLLTSSASLTSTALPPMSTPSSKADRERRADFLVENIFEVGFGYGCLPVITILALFLLVVGL